MRWTCGIWPIQMRNRTVQKQRGGCRYSIRLAGQMIPGPWYVSDGLPLHNNNYLAQVLLAVASKFEQ